MGVKRWYQIECDGTTAMGQPCFMQTFGYEETRRAVVREAKNWDHWKLIGGKWLCPSCQHEVNFQAERAARQEAIA